MSVVVAPSWSHKGQLASSGDMHLLEVGLKCSFSGHDFTMATPSEQTMYFKQSGGYGFFIPSSNIPHRRVSGHVDRAVLRSVVPPSTVCGAPVVRKISASSDVIVIQPMKSRE